MAVQEETQRLIDITNDYLAECPATVRAIYYHLVTLGALQRCKASYDKVKAFTAKARRSGAIGYDSIIDNGRSAVQPATWKSLADRAYSARNIRLDPWQDQGSFCGIIIEKDAAKHLVEPLCQTYDVPLYPLRGDTSLSFMYSMAKEIAASGKPTRLGYWGDLDPGGMSIGRAAERNLREILASQFGIDAPDLEWKRLGINIEDMEAYNLSPIPGREMDTKLAAFIQEFGVSHGAEIDALPREVIGDRTEKFIKSCIDSEVWDETKARHKQDEDKWHEMMDSIKGELYV